MSRETLPEVLGDIIEIEYNTKNVILNEDNDEYEKYNEDFNLVENEYDYNNSYEIKKNIDMKIIEEIKKVMKF